MRALLLPIKDLRNAKKRLMDVLTPEERFALAEMPCSQIPLAPSEVCAVRKRFL